MVYYLKRRRYHCNKIFGSYSLQGSAPSFGLINKPLMKKQAQKGYEASLEKSEGGEFIVRSLFIAGLGESRPKRFTFLFKVDNDMPRAWAVWV